MKNILFFISIGMILGSCHIPKATILKSKIKETIPIQYDSQELNDSNSNSGAISWKEFFTDNHLKNLIDTALKYNQDLMITLQEIEISKSEVLAKKGKLTPIVSAQLGAGFDKAGRYTSAGAGDASTDITPGNKVPEILGEFSGGFVANWEVDIWRKLRTEKESAITHYLATIEGKNFVLSNLIAEIAHHYYELLSLDNRLDIVDKFIKLQKQALEISKIQKQAAAATELAVKKFEAELAKSSSIEYELKQEIFEKENQLNLLLGRFPQKIIREKEVLLNSSPQIIMKGIPSQLLSNRSDIKQAELELKASKLDVEVARKEFYPSLDITASLGLEAFKPSYLAKLPESLVMGLAGDLAGVVLNKNAIQANFKAADARQIQAMYDYERKILNAFAEVSSLMSKEKNLEQYYELKTKEVSYLEQSIDITSQLFKNSRADYLEVLLNQRDALDAKMDLIEAKENQMINAVDLYKSLGGGYQ